MDTFKEYLSSRKNLGHPRKKTAKKRKLKKIFLVALWKNLEALILLALNMAKDNELSLRLLMSYISQ